MAVKEFYPEKIKTYRYCKKDNSSFPWIEEQTFPRDSSLNKSGFDELKFSPDGHHLFIQSNLSENVIDTYSFSNTGDIASPRWVERLPIVEDISICHKLTRVSNDNALALMGCLDKKDKPKRVLIDIFRDSGVSWEHEYTIVVLDDLEPAYDIHQLEFSPDGSRLLMVQGKHATGAAGVKDCKAIIYRHTNIGHWEVERTFNLNRPNGFVKFSPEGSRIVVVSSTTWNPVIHLYHYDTNEEYWQLEETIMSGWEFINDVRFSPGGLCILITGQVSQKKFRAMIYRGDKVDDRVQWKIEKTFEVKGHISAAGFSPDGCYALVCGEDVVQLYGKRDGVTVEKSFSVKLLPQLKLSSSLLADIFGARMKINSDEIKSQGDITDEQKKLPTIKWVEETTRFIVNGKRRDLHYYEREMGGWDTYESTMEGKVKFAQFSPNSTHLLIDVNYADGRHSHDFIYPPDEFGCLFLFGLQKLDSTF
ncbi:hypothetical protein [Endozoicomonas sp. Mp262]|uniref:WD40 repeat domain-containing protein n=1 Tax=Endozoicomonas sp. Mp262 TaxID=2919499 RepID=UPI0021DACF4A